MTDSFSRAELESCGDSAYKSQRIQDAVSSPESVFGPIPPSEAETVSRKSKLYSKRFKECVPDLSKTFLVEDLIHFNSTVVVFGRTNCGKSFWVLDLALHIALGLPWDGRRVEKGPVVYCAAEAGASVERRLYAFRLHKQLEGQDVDLDLVPCSLDLLKPSGDTLPLLELIAGLKEKPALIVIDTVARSMPGGDENASKDMSSFFENIDTIRKQTGSTVLMVHHSGKDKSKGSRGHSSLPGAIETEIEITAEGNERCARVEKQRDGETDVEMGFSLQVVYLGMDAYGKSVTSCVVQHKKNADSEAETKAKDGGGPKVSAWFYPGIR